MEMEKPENKNALLMRTLDQVNFIQIILFSPCNEDTSANEGTLVWVQGGPHYSCSTVPARDCESTY